MAGKFGYILRITVAGALTVGAAVCHGGEKIQFNNPGKSSEADAQSSRHQLELDMGGQGGRSNFGPSSMPQSGRPSQDSSRQTDEKRLRQLLDRNKNWIFEDPKAFGASDSDDFFGTSSAGENGQSSGRDQDLSLIEQFLSGGSSKEKRRRESEDDDPFASDDESSFDSFLSDSPLFEQLEVGLGNDSENRMFDSFDPNKKESLNGWEVLFGSAAGASRDAKDQILSPSELKLEELAQKFSAEVFTSTSFLSEVGEYTKFNALSEFETLINPGASRLGGLMDGNNLINQATDPGSRALNPIEGLNATESIRFSNTISDFSANPSRASQPIGMGGDLFQRELPTSGAGSIRGAIGSETRASEGVPRLPIFFEMPKTRGF